jgi:glycerol-3-phosphate O-acyltransferase
MVARFVVQPPRIMIRPVKEAENRLEGFNAEREAILADVERRVIGARVAAARGGAAGGGYGNERSLEYVLNDVVFQEIRRLERGPASRGEKKRLPEWRDLARRLGSMDEAEKQDRLVALVRDYSRDVCGNFNRRVYRFATNILPPVLGGFLGPKNLSEGLAGLGALGGRVLVDGPIEQIRTCADRGTLVVTPTHSSNMDSVVLGWSLHHAGLPPCTYGAGKNLFSNRFLSFFMHNLGAYRVDRRLANAIYKDVLKTYSQVLLERGYHSLFFPGGTRCRSNIVEKKLKLGLLGTVLPAYQENLRAGQPQKRLYVVPATINYGIVLEAETLIDDFLAEEGKHRYIIEDDESSRLGRILDFARRILTLEGAVHIRYGAPIDPFGNDVDADGESLDARGRRVDPALYVAGDDGRPVQDAQRDAEYTRGVGEALTRAYRRLTVFQPTNLVARAIFDAAAEAKRTRDVYQLIRLQDGVEVPIEKIRQDVAAWRDRIAAHPDQGAVAERLRTMRPGDIVDDALRLFKGYHRVPAAERAGESVVVRDMRLVFYYQNRTAHIRTERTAQQ